MHAEDTCGFEHGTSETTLSVNQSENRKRNNGDSSIQLTDLSTNCSASMTNTTLQSSLQFISTQFNVRDPITNMYELDSKS